MYFIIKKLGCRLVGRKPQRPPGRGDVEGVDGYYACCKVTGASCVEIAPH